jgi:hypothetical protein
MQVRVVRPFKIKGRLQEIGTLLKLPESAVLLLAGRVQPVGDESLMDEYQRLLKRYHEIDQDPAATMDEVRQLVQRLDALYRELARQGKTMLVRI